MKPIALTTLTLLFAASCSPSNDAENPGKSGSQAGDEKPAVEAPAKIPSGNVDLATAKQLFDDAKAGKSKLVILDVRTDEEFKDGHLEGAVNIDYLVPEADFRTALEKLDREARYLMHCQVGGRSADALEIMTEMGFKSVYHMIDGYGKWARAGYEVTKD